MKTRIGFVSNSSSMSFIVAVKKRGKCPHCKQTPINLLDIVERSGGGETSMDAKGKKAVLAYIEKEMECYFDDDEPERQEMIEEVKSIGKDFEVACIHISENDEFLQGLVESKDVVKIYG